MELDKNSLPRVAYFCMEFGLHEDFKIYAGGLGILAGDILKTAKDLQCPVTGIGILWRQGYTTQSIDEKGRICDSYPEYRYPFLKDTGVTVSVKIRDNDVKAKVWLCTEYDNVPLYLLDTNLPGNPDSLITGQLYGWFEEERIAQEMILSIGGVRALRALGIEVDIYHFNDSHPVLAGAELIRERMENQGLSFEEAYEKTRSQIVFTTHTPVEAGNEYHKHDVLKYMGAYGHLNYDQMVKLGGDPFSMTAAGLRLSKISNAVSKLHGETARNMWKGVDGSSEIIAITNGVHMGTWQDKRMKNAYENDGDIWSSHVELKKEMIDEVFKRSGIKLDENVLTIGIARRAAAYKRSNLLFRRREIIEPLLRQKKLQIIFSGKAHPNDLSGKDIIKDLYDISNSYPESVIFLQDYNMKIGKLLTRGCDIWLNNPIRPMEASGTSGMKAAMNGVLNLSVLDGWWAESCEHGVNGWQIGNGYSGPDSDRVDSESLYSVLLNEVLPLYYNDRAKWIEMMKSSIRMSVKDFSSERMLKEYYEKMYEK